MGAPSVLGYYDWMLPANRTNVGIIDPAWTVTDSSTGGSTVGSIGNLYDRSIATQYGRNSIDRTLSQLFLIDIRTNAPVGGETTALYGAIVVSGVYVRDTTTQKWVAGKVTCTIDSNAGSYGGGAVYNQAALIGSAANTGRSTYPSAVAAFCPHTINSTVKANGGDGGTSCNKIRIKVEPQAGTSGGTGVPSYDVRIGRIAIMRCHYPSVSPTSLKDDVADPSTIVRAYDGTPYVNPRRSLRTLSGKMVNITKAMKFGVGDYFPSIVAINVHAGIKNEVFFAPFQAPPAGELVSGSFHESWSNQHIFGLFNDSLQTRLVTKTSAGTDDAWEADFAITENTP